jgi:hypothetical protein
MSMQPSKIKKPRVSSFTVSSKKAVGPLATVNENSPLKLFNHNTGNSSIMEQTFEGDDDGDLSFEKLDSPVKASGRSVFGSKENVPPLF